MSEYLNVYIDKDFYYMFDPSDKVFRFHYFYALAYDKETIKELMDDLSNVFNKYGIEWFNNDDDDYDYYQDPLNSNHEQDSVIDYFKGDELYNYIRDVAEVAYRYKVVAIRSADSRSFLELDNINLNIFKTLYEAQIGSVISRYYGYLGDEADDKKIRLITSSKDVVKYLRDNEYDFTYEFNDDDYTVLGVFLDFLHSIYNLSLKLAAKKKLGEKDTKLFDLLKLANFAFKDDFFFRFRKDLKEKIEQEFGNKKEG